MKKAIDVISTVLIVLLVALVLLLHGSKLIGINTYAVLSGSMEPSYPTGSIVYVRPIAGDEVKIDDPITFCSDGKTVVTHRAVKIDAEAKTIVTRGDANETDDAAIGFDDVIGKVVFSVPLLGYVAVFLSTVAGKCFLVAGFLLAIILILLSEKVFKNNA